MRKPRTFTQTLLAAAVIALSPVVLVAAPANADTMVGACNVISSPTAGTHTICIGQDLSGENFNTLDLRFADLTGSNLAGATFTGADLTDADLTGAAAPGTNFTNTHLDGATFTGADISGADFEGSSAIPGAVTLISPLGAPTAYAFPPVGNNLARNCSPTGPFAPGSTTVVCTVSSPDLVTTSSNASFVVTVVVPSGITGASSAVFTAGTAGTYIPSSVTGTPAPVVSAAGLPPGLTVNATTGEISGTPSVGSGGVYAVTLTATNGETPDATLVIELTVNEALAISGDPTGTFTEGTSGGSYLPTVTGFPAPTFSATGLPVGLTIDATTGEITGTPDDGSEGTYPITITATNGIGAPVTLNLTLIIEPAPPAPITPDGPADSSADESLLPDTGGIALGLLPIGVALVAAGALSMRRRQVYLPSHRS